MVHHFDVDCLHCTVEQPGAIRLRLVREALKNETRVSALSSSLRAKVQPTISKIPIHWCLAILDCFLISRAGLDAVRDNAVPQSPPRSVPWVLRLGYRWVSISASSSAYLAELLPCLHFISAAGCHASSENGLFTSPISLSVVLRSCLDGLNPFASD